MLLAEVLSHLPSSLRFGFQDTRTDNSASGSASLHTLHAWHSTFAESLHNLWLRARGHAMLEARAHPKANLTSTSRPTLPQMHASTPTMLGLQPRTSVSPCWNSLLFSHSTSPACQLARSSSYRPGRRTLTAASSRPSSARPLRPNCKHARPARGASCAATSSATCRLADTSCRPRPRTA
jgi:hypothetical protein